MPSSFLTLRGVSGNKRGRQEQLVARGDEDIHLGGFSDSEGTHSNCMQKVRGHSDRVDMATAAAGNGPATVIEDAPGSIADMSIGLMFHGRLDCCLASHLGLASVRLDSTRSGFENRWNRMGWDQRRDEKECSWGERCQAADARRETKDRRVLCLLGQGTARRGWFLV